MLCKSDVTNECNVYDCLEFLNAKNKRYSPVLHCVTCHTFQIQLSSQQGRFCIVQVHGFLSPQTTRYVIFMFIKILKDVLGVHICIVII